MFVVILAGSLAGASGHDLLMGAPAGRRCCARLARGLEEEGIEKFIKPYDAVMEAIRKKGAGG